jgi:hypothetical protein
MVALRNLHTPETPMTRPADQASEQIQPAAPRPPAAGPPDVPPPEPRAALRIPLRWRIVLMIWATAFSLLVSVELLSLIVKLFGSLRK